MENTLTETVIDHLVDHISPYTIYIFGSYAKGTTHPESDLDIAFVTDEKIDTVTTFKVAQELAGKLNLDVDLVNLKDASTVFQAQIVTSGEVIYCINDTKRMYDEMWILKQYAKLNEERSVIIRRIKESGSVYGE